MGTVVEIRVEDQNVLVENKVNNLKSEEKSTTKNTSRETIKDSEPTVIKKDKIELKYNYRDGKHLVFQVCPVHI